MKNEKKTLLALIVLAVVLLIWRGLGAPALPRESSDVKPIAEVVGDGGEASVAIVSVAAPSKAISTATPGPPSSLVPAIRAQRLDDYADSQDLQQFIDSLRAAADAGDGEAAAFIARAYDECFPSVAAAFAGRRTTFDPATLTEPQRSIAATQIAITKRRCAAIAAEAVRQGSGWTLEQIKSFWAKARDGGELSQLLNNRDVAKLELSSADDNELLRRIATSGNDDAIAMLSLLVDYSNDDRDIHGPFSGTSVDVIAWMLVSCDFGRDCEPNGRLVREKCLANGQCVAGSYRDYLRYYVNTPYQFDEALKKERQILDLLARGAVDELFPLRPKRD